MGCKKKSKWVFNKPDNVSYLRANYKTGVVSGRERTKHPTQKFETNERYNSSTY